MTEVVVARSSAIVELKIVEYNLPFAVAAMAEAVVAYEFGFTVMAEVIVERTAQSTIEIYKELVDYVVKQQPSDLYLAESGRAAKPASQAATVYPQIIGNI